MAVITIQFVSRRMLRMSEVQFVGLCLNGSAHVSSRRMADVARSEIATLSGRAGGVTLKAGCVSARPDRYGKCHTATGRFVTRTASNIRMPPVVKSGAETLKARKRPDLSALRFRGGVTGSTYRVFQAGELL